MSAAERKALELVPHVRAIGAYREGQAALLRALAIVTGEPSSGQRWAIGQALAAVPRERRGELAEEILSAGVAHMALGGWTDETEQALQEVVADAVDEQFDAVAAAIEAGAW